MFDSFGNVIGIDERIIVDILVSKSHFGYLPAVNIEFHPRETSMLCGGFHNGTVACYDIRKGSECVVTSQLHISHRDYVTKVLWVNSKSNAEFFSAGEDGGIHSLLLIKPSRNNSENFSELQRIWDFHKISPFQITFIQN